MQVVTFLLFTLLPSTFVSQTTPSVHPDLATMARDMAAVKQTITSLRMKVNAATTEITSLKADLHRTETELVSAKDEIVAIKAELRSTQNMQVQMKADLQNCSSAAEVSKLKMELASVRGCCNVTTGNGSEFQVLKNSVSIQTTQYEISACSAASNQTAARLQTLESMFHMMDNSSLMMHPDANNSAEIQELTKELASLKAKTDGLDLDVAFHATKRHHTGWETNVLKFDSVDYNLGQAYDKSSGMFTAPKHGTYMFWATIQYYNAYGYVNIMKGAHPLATGYGETAPDRGALRSVASAVTVVRLTKGEKIYFTAAWPTHVVPNADEASYGGVLLHTLG